MKLNPLRERLTGLFWTLSRGRRTPEAPTAPATVPDHPLVHERDEGLDVAPTESVVGDTDHVDRHGRQCTSHSSSKPRTEKQRPEHGPRGPGTARQLLQPSWKSTEGQGLTRPTETLEKASEKTDISLP